MGDVRFVRSLRGGIRTVAQHVDECDRSAQYRHAQRVADVLPGKNGKSRRVEKRNRKRITQRRTRGQRGAYCNRAPSAIAFNDAFGERKAAEHGETRETEFNEVITPAFDDAVERPMLEQVRLRQNLCGK